MNKNVIKTDGFSSPQSEELYRSLFAADLEVQRLYEAGAQCGGCSFFAPLNADWGVCCHPQSRHRTETVFEHFTCANFVEEGWRIHSFSQDTSLHCQCQGESREHYEKLIQVLKNVISIAPEPILRAGMDTVGWACIFIRNQTIHDGAPTKIINDAMEAIHAVPQMLTDWQDGNLRVIRSHLGCFPASRWPGAPDLVAFFEQRLRDYGYDENAA